MKDKIQRILIDESQIPVSMQVNTRYRSFSEQKTGIFNLVERCRLEYPHAKIYYKHQNPLFTALFLKRNPDGFAHAEENVDLIFKPETETPWNLLTEIPGRIDTDISLHKELKKWRSKFKVKLEEFSVIGKKKQLYIHPSANIYPGVVFDVSSGPIVIDRHVRITPFSFLEGPLYIGENSMIDNARITGGCIIGHTCRIGGEVENSMIGNFSNKHHEGFLGHSFLGSWVNIGALATTSDLKNNYGFIRIKIGEEQINTETIKFGSIIGDFSKIGIGTMLNTGSVVDIACNLVGPGFSGYMPPFSWLQKDNRYRLDYFLENTKKVMARRDFTLSEEAEILLKNLYES
ncbi:MAG: glucose-1-phosphate thymidylyltransferase [Leptospiraceae bacterium]|nr:glucose-1-phosphate thymidylyltransferase [Leptospiraceae bacterium]MCP5498653.1 glucose-1-phosphate thymidylyltransferase [Leptospiraceae bacterium]